MRHVSRAFQAPGLADEEGNPTALPKIMVGVCAMDKKARSKPMLAICKRLLVCAAVERTPIKP